MLEELKILIVEDEALIALDLSMTLEDQGAGIQGPCSSLTAAMTQAQGVDAAVLDVDLRGETVFPLADSLQERGIPFVFHTGRANMDELRARYGDEVPVVVKPSSTIQVVKSIARVTGRA